MESDFERAPTAGWTAVTDERLHQSLVFTMDYGPLLFLYNCLQNTTVEWQYVQQAIPPGQTWETNVTAVLVRDFPGLVHRHAGRALRRGVRRAPGRAGHLPAGQPHRPSDHFGILHPEGAEAAKPARSRAARHRDEGFAVGAATRHRALPGPFTEQIALQVDASLAFVGGERKHEHFETFYGGTLGFAGANRTLDTPPMYPIPPQPKQLTFLKPEHIARARQATPRVLVLNGQFSDAWQPAQAVAALPGELKTGEEFASSSIASAVTYWPVRL